MALPAEEKWRGRATVFGAPFPNSRRLLFWRGKRNDLAALLGRNPFCDLLEPVRHVELNYFCHHHAQSQSQRI